MRVRWAVTMSITERDSMCSSYSGSSSSCGGRGVDVPVRKRGVEVPARRGVDVPETEGVAGAVGTLGTNVVILNATSPESVG
jgi:hypothetical protein